MLNNISLAEAFLSATSTPLSSEDEALLLSMIDQMSKTAVSADQAIEEAISYIHASNVRIAQMYDMTREALADVDAGNVVDHQTVQAWAESISAAKARDGQ